MLEGSIVPLYPPILALASLTVLEYASPGRRSPEITKMSPCGALWFVHRRQAEKGHKKGTTLPSTYHPIKFNPLATKHVTSRLVNNFRAEVTLVPCGTCHVHGNP